MYLIYDFFETRTYLFFENILKRENMNATIRHNDYSAMNLPERKRSIKAELCAKSIDNYSASDKLGRFGWPFGIKEVTGEEAVHRR